MNKTRVYTIILLITACTLITTPVQEAKAAVPIATIIKEGVKKVIKAIDLMIQRLQTKTIWLQNAQKVIENKLSQLKLTEIAQWTEKQRTQYKKYFDELWKIRNTLQTYQRIRQITERQIFLVQEYKRTWELINQDKHFTRMEVDYMYRTYTGIIDDSIFNLEQLMLVINSFKTQMSDAKRLEIINKAGDGIDQNYADLKKFNNQNIQLSLNRAKGEHEIEAVRRLYGIN
ncbi:MAG TPA: conjugal transfer protein TraI [Cyclobacteriaceae bacterium]|nr:conjugal transfer protein TraI [Cyclobacteriaceae bacterium]